MSSASEGSSLPPRRRTIQKAVRWMKRLDSTCYTYQTRTFACQQTSRFLRTFVIYRWIIMLLWVITVVITLGDLGRPPTKITRDVSYYLKYFIFISNQALILVLLQVTLGVFVVTRSAVSHTFGNHPQAHVPVKRIELFYWKLYELSVGIALSVTVSYWLLIYPLRKTPSDLNNYLTHLVNSVLAVADWLITGLPHNLSDAWIGLLYGLGYMVFTTVYWHAGGTARASHTGATTRREIYPGCTEWNQISISVGCFVLLGCIYCMCHVALCLANALLKKYQPPTSVMRSDNFEIHQPRVVTFRRRPSYFP